MRGAYEEASGSAKFSGSKDLYSYLPMGDFILREMPEAALNGLNAFNLGSLQQLTLRCVNKCKGISLSEIVSRDSSKNPRPSYI